MNTKKLFGSMLVIGLALGINACGTEDDTEEAGKSVVEIAEDKAAAANNVTYEFLDNDDLKIHFYGEGTRTSTPAIYIVDEDSIQAIAYVHARYNIIDGNITCSVDNRTGNYIDYNCKEDGKAGVEYIRLEENKIYTIKERDKEIIENGEFTPVLRLLNGNTSITLP